MQPTSHPRFHGPERFIQAVGNLRLGVAGCVEIDYDPLGFRELSHRVMNAFPANTLPRLVGRVWFARGDLVVLVFRLGSCSPRGRLWSPPLAPELIERKVVGNAEQPGKDSSFGLTIRAGVVPGAKEYLLQDILGCLAIAHDAEEQRVDLPGVAIVECFHRLGFARDNVRDQLPIGIPVVRAESLHQRP